MINNKIARFLWTTAALLGMLALPSASVFAAVTTSAPATTQVSSDTAVTGSVALPAITLTEGAAGDIPAGAFTLAVPTGFLFDTTSTASVSATGTGLSVVGTVSFVDGSHARVNVTATSTTPGSVTIGATVPLKVKVSSGTPPATTGNIMLSDGTLTGLATSTSFGTLIQVPGAANKLAFTIQPPSTLTTGSAFNTSVSVEDQFGNVVTSDNGRSIILSVVPVSPTTTTGSLSGSTTVNDASGVANFNSLSFNQTGSIELNASSTGLAAALSNLISLTASSTPTPTSTPTSTPPFLSCGLHNGMLVKVEGSPTVYMVVNCVLRPFNSAAIFHAHGKKFEDIIILNASSTQFSIGRPIGEGNDDDSTIIIPPTGTSTPSSTLPNISGLPDGSVVKLPNDPTIYLVSGGQLQPFTSAITFNLRGKHFKDVKTISQDQFSQLTVGAPVTVPDGTVVKGSGKTVFLVSNGQLLGIPNPQVLQKHGKSFKDIVQINDGDLQQLPHGGDAD